MSGAKARPPCPVEIEAWVRGSPPPLELLRAFSHANRRDRERAVATLLRARFAFLSDQQLEAGVRSLCSDGRLQEQWSRFCDFAAEERARNDAYSMQALACVVELRQALAAATGSEEE